MTRWSLCGLGVSCNEMSDTPMLLVVMERGSKRSAEAAEPIDLKIGLNMDS